MKKEKEREKLGENGEKGNWPTGYSLSFLPFFLLSYFFHLFFFFVLFLFLLYFFSFAFPWTNNGLNGEKQCCRFAESANDRLIFFLKWMFLFLRQWTWTKPWAAVKKAGQPCLHVTFTPHASRSQCPKMILSTQNTAKRAWTTSALWTRCGLTATSDLQNRCGLEGK